MVYISLYAIKYQYLQISKYNIHEFKKNILSYFNKFGTNVAFIVWTFLFYQNIKTFLFIQNINLSILIHIKYIDPH